MRGRRSITSAIASLSAGAHAARVCGNSPSTFPWRVGDVRFDGANPSNGNAYATIAVSITPAPRGTLFECVAQWPESWAGRYEGGDDIIWSDCIWTGNGGTVDRTISFAYDWNNQTFHLSHTFDCSDDNGSKALALGSADIDLTCTTTDGIQSCDLAGSSSVNLTTTETSGRVDPGATCEDNAERYQSWEVSEWFRQYKLAPGSGGSPSDDTGPSFTLENVGSGNLLDCTTSESLNGTFVGSCTPSEEASRSTADFRFDSVTNLLAVTEHWICESGSPFDALGIVYVQSRCSRSGEVLTCELDPVWIGTKDP